MSKRSYGVVDWLFERNRRRQREPTGLSIEQLRGIGGVKESQ
ncbi:hypothetical protein [Bacillus sp. SG-1]|nr:hypothetical protein [Bacillus sp. SG-1]